MMIKEYSLNNKKVTILGAGRSGVAVARLLQEKQAKVFVSESAGLNEKKKEIYRKRH